MPGAVPPPAIVGLQYEKEADTGTIIFTLEARPAVPVTVALFKGNPLEKGWVTSMKARARTGAITVEAAKLESGQQYTVAVTADPDETPVAWGPPVVLVFDQPTVEKARFADGALEIGWQLPGSTTVTQVSATIYDNKAQRVVVSETFTQEGGFSGGTVQSGARLRPPVPLDPSGSYGLYVFGQRGVAKGPIVWLPSDLILTAPVLAQGTCETKSGGTALVTIEPKGVVQTSQAAPAPVGCLLCDGVVVKEAEITGSATKAEITLPEALDPARSWRLGLLYRSGVLSGPLGATAEIPLVPPRLVQAAWDGEEFELGWEGSGSVGAAVEITGPDGVLVGSAEVGEGRWTTLKPTKTIEPSAAYQVRLAPILGSVRGPYGPSTALGVSQLTIASVYCEAGQATVALSGAAQQGPGGPWAILELYDSGARLLSVEVGPSGGALSLPAAWSSTLSVKARRLHAVEGVAGRVIGPPSAAVELPLKAPELTAAEWIPPTNPGEAAKCALDWQWSPGGTVPAPTPTQYEVLLVEGRAESVLATITAPATGGTVSVASVPPPGATLSVRAVAGSAHGPRGSGLLVPATSAPELRSVNAVSKGVEVELGAPDPPGERCLVTLYEGATKLGGAWSEGGRAVVPLQAAAPKALYEVHAVAVAAEGRSKGPASTRQALLVPPTLSSPAFDGESIAVTVAPPEAGGVTPTGYRVELLRDGAVVRREEPVTPTQNQLTVPAERIADPVVSSSLRVTPLTVGAVGPPAAIAVLLAAPVVTAASVSGGSSDRAVSVSIDASGFAGDVAFEAVLFVDGRAGAPVTVSGGQATLPVPSDATTVAVAARAKGVATGAWSAQALVPLTAPTVTARRDGPVVSAWWSGDNAAEYRVTLLAGSAETAVAEPVVRGLAANLPAPIDSTATYKLSVQQLAGPALGPKGTATLFAAAPALTECGFSASDGSLKVAWSAVPGATKYQLQWRRAGKVALEKSLEATSLTLTAKELPGGATYELRIRAIPTSGDNSPDGPWSEPVRVAALSPGGVSAGYDGRVARVRWDALPGPDAAGYLVTVRAGTREATTTVEGTSATLPFKLESEPDATVVVQALTAIGAGPPSAAVSLFPPGLYPSTAKQKPPYLVPAKTAALAKADVVVQLPQIFTTPPAKTELPTGPFAIAEAASPFSYTLTMAATSAVWEFGGEAIRADVATAYASLLATLTRLNVTPLGWRTVQDAIARSMPQTFAETLLYACGFKEGCVDLVPGMVLRAEYQSYQYLGPDAQSAELLDGFLTTAAAEYEVASYASPSAPWLTGFDAFLGRLVASGGVSVPEPKRPSPGGLEAGLVAGGGGVADLYYPQLSRPFCRLVYPPTLASPSEPGTPRPPFNVAVVASDDYQTLLAACAEVRNRRDPPGGATVTYLRGRTTLSACVRVWLDGVPAVVPLGSTVANLLEGMGRRPPVVDGMPIDGLHLVRGSGAAILDATVGANGYPIGAGQTVHLDWGANTQYAPGADVLTLPLLPGDRVVTGA